MNLTAKQIELTQVLLKENFEVTYQKKSSSIFSWLVKIKEQSIGKDLVINTAEKYDRIILNGVELTNISNQTL
jgi:hypothetical protein